jgi:hypothetical protein
MLQSEVVVSPFNRNTVVLEATLVIANNASPHCAVNTLVQTAAAVADHDHLEN